MPRYCGRGIFKPPFSDIDDVNLKEKPCQNFKITRELVEKVKLDFKLMSDVTDTLKKKYVEANEALKQLNDRIEEDNDNHEESESEDDNDDDTEETNQSENTSANMQFSASVLRAYQELTLKFKIYGNTSNTLSKQFISAAKNILRLGNSITDISQMDIDELESSEEPESDDPEASNVEKQSTELN